MPAARALRAGRCGETPGHVSTRVLVSTSRRRLSQPCPGQQRRWPFLPISSAQIRQSVADLIVDNRPRSTIRAAARTRLRTTPSTSIYLCSDRDRRGHPADPPPHPTGQAHASFEPCSPPRSQQPQAAAACVAQAARAGAAPVAEPELLRRFSDAVGEVLLLVRSSPRRWARPAAPGDGSAD